MEEVERVIDLIVTYSHSNVLYSDAKLSATLCEIAASAWCAIISKGRIACRFNRTTQTRKATPASVWRTRCVIRRQLRALRIAPPATRVHLLWVKRRRGGCSFLSIVLYTSTLFSILASLTIALPLHISLFLSHSHSVWWTSRLVCRSTAAHAKRCIPEIDYTHIRNF